MGDSVSQRMDRNLAYQGQPTSGRVSKEGNYTNWLVNSVVGPNEHLLVSPESSMNGTISITDITDYGEMK